MFNKVKGLIFKAKLRSKSMVAFYGSDVIEEYIGECEHGEGPGYFGTFPNFNEVLEDFAGYYSTAKEYGTLKDDSIK